MKNSPQHESSDVASQPFCVSDLRPAVLKAEYAIEGAICIKADQIALEMKKGKKFPFPELIRCNIGNPFELGKKEITFPRQLIAATECEAVRKSDIFPKEVRDRAQEFLDNISGGLGAYSGGAGHDFVRENVAKFILERDGYPANPNHIILTNGASHAVKRTLEMFIKDTHVGVLVPLPTYPVYTAEIVLRGGIIIPCYLDESEKWKLHVSVLENQYNEAKSNGIDPRILVLINPSNPTGAVMTKNEIECIIRFCEERNVLIMADEVYQNNIYNNERPFVPVRRLVCEMKSKVQMISIHSISKGFLGECGHRGGYMEFYNIDEKVIEQGIKMATIDQCSSTVGQLLLDLMVRPPTSPECRSLWDEEKNRELTGLKEKADRLVEAMNKMPGISCTTADGAMYVFPSLHLPQKAIDEAKELIIDGEPAEPDMFWSWNLLIETGIVTVPGSGFGQSPGSYHFRIAFLPPPDKMERLITKMSDFQERFMQKYA